MSGRPEHVERLDQALSEREFLLDAAAAPEMAIGVAYLFEETLRKNKDAAQTLLAEIGSGPFYRGLLNAGFFDDKPEKAREQADRIERSRYMFEQLLVHAGNIEDARITQEAGTAEGHENG